MSYVGIRTARSGPVLHCEEILITRSVTSKVLINVEKYLFKS